MGKLAWIVVLFLLAGGYIIYSNLKTDFSSPADVNNFIGAATGWVFQVGKSTYNVGKAAYGQQWLPEINNQTFVVEDKKR